MKRIIYSQRVEIVDSYKERRDCADQQIPGFIYACGYLPIPIFNIPEILPKFLDELLPDGIFLTGGNSLESFGGNAKERDTIDHMLISFALEREIPLYGFCRGMQSILVYFDNRIENVKGHVAVQHKLLGLSDDYEVNSFHNQGCYIVKHPLEVIAWTEDGIAEAVQHKEKKILGTMWHPERVSPFDKNDIERVKQFIG